MHSKSCVAEHGENFHVAQSQQTKDFSFEQASHFVLVYRVRIHSAHLLNNWPILSLQRKLAALMASIRPGPDFTCSGQASLSRQNSPLLSPEFCRHCLPDREWGWLYRRAWSA